MINRTLAMALPGQDVNHLELSQLITGQAVLQVVAAQIVENGHDVPDDLAVQLNEIDAALSSKLRADKMRRLQIARQRREALATNAEKRSQVEDEITALEAELSGGNGSKATPARGSKSRQSTRRK